MAKIRIHMRDNVQRTFDIPNPDNKTNTQLMDGWWKQFEWGTIPALRVENNVFIMKHVVLVEMIDENLDIHAAPS